MAFEKGSTGRFALIVVIVAMVAGYAVSGTLLYHSVIGLDSSAFQAGEWLQRDLRIHGSLRGEWAVSEDANGGGFFRGMWALICR